VCFYDVLSSVEDSDKTKPLEKKQIIKECLDGHTLSPCPPFAISNPSHLMKKKGGDTNILGREYHYGFAESLNPKITDFKRLHKLVLKYIRSELV
jgi:septin family protein